MVNDRWVDVDADQEPLEVYLPRVVTIAGSVWAAREARHALRNWGATPHEIEGWFPGADVVPGGRRTPTMAITVDAPPARVWSELVAAFDGRVRSGDDREPPSVEVGARLPTTPDDSGHWTVATVDPERFLGLRLSTDLRGRPCDPVGSRRMFSIDRLWGFRLRPLGTGRTRLVVSGFQAVRPNWLRPPVAAVPNLAGWITQIRWLEALKELVESAQQAATAGPSTRT